MYYEPKWILLNYSDFYQDIYHFLVIHGNVVVMTMVGAKLLSLYEEADSVDVFIIVR